MERIIYYINNVNNDNILNILIFVAIIIMFNLISPFISYLIVKIINLGSKDKKPIKENYLYIVLKSFLKVLGIYLAILFLRLTFNISDNVMGFITKIFKIMVILTMANVLANSITMKSRFSRNLEKRLGKNKTTIQFVLKLIRVIIYVIAIFMVIFEIGYDLSGLVTGLGLGGVVLTLAAQDTAKNLFGGIMIFLDKPFKVGDYIRFKEHEGTVEDISFRSTKVRTLENSLLHIPNSEVTSGVVINFSEINKRRYKLNLVLVLDTELKKLNKFADDIKKMLINNEHILNDTINVNFIEIVSNGLRLQVSAYINISDYLEFLRVKEKINYCIMQIVKTNNIGLAYDTQTIEIKQ